MPPARSAISASNVATDWFVKQFPGQLDHFVTVTPHQGHNYPEDRVISYEARTSRGSLRWKTLPNHRLT